MDSEALKQKAAVQAVALIQSGMRVGLGSGSTSRHAILELGRRVREGELKGITGVATSVSSEHLALEQGLKVEPLDSRPLNIAIDGADEIDPQLNLIKGLGGALLREKMVEVQATQLVIIVDASKVVSRLGERVPLPIEIVPFAFERTLERLRQFGALELRLEGENPYITDNGNYIVHLTLRNNDVYALERSLKGTLGVIETGLFLSMASRAFIAHPDRVEERLKERSSRMYGEDK